MSIQEQINQVETFNVIAGNLDHITEASLIAQAKVVREEALELYEAVSEGTPNEILKELCDCLVVTIGFMKMLEKQGYDVLAAWDAVNRNNYSKYEKHLAVAEGSVEYYKAQGIDVTIEYNDYFGVYILRDAAGKVRKPITYQKVNVAQYTPKGIPPVKVED